MYYSIVSNRVESWESRKSIINEYILSACIVTPPWTILFSSVFFFFCLWIFSVLILTFVYPLVWKCFQHSFNCPGHVCNMWWDPCLSGWMLIGWLQRGKDISGGKEEKNIKRTKYRVCIFQFVNSPYAWKLKSKSGTCLHNFEILKYLFFTNIEKGVLLPCRLSLFTPSIVYGSLEVVGNKAFALSSSVFSEQYTGYTLSVTLNGDW